MRFGMCCDLATQHSNSGQVDLCETSSLTRAVPLALADCGSGWNRRHQHGRGTRGEVTGATRPSLELLAIAVVPRQDAR
ncbi:unnamed protein product [Urochloa humidicola]